MTEPSLFQDFIVETTEHLEEMEEHLLNLEKSPDNAELLNTIFRCVHTIKGSAEYLGMEKIATLMHNLESLLDRVRNKDLEINRKIIDIIITSGDVVGRLTEDLVREKKELTSIEGPLDQIVRLLEQDGTKEMQRENYETAEPLQPSKDKENDDELFVIFVQNLREGLTEFTQTFSRINSGGDPAQVLEKCLECIDSLASSANYMGYDRLSTICTELKTDVEKILKELLEPAGSPSTEQATEIVQNHVTAICRLFDIGEMDLGVVMEPPEQTNPVEKGSPEDLPEDFQESLDLTFDAPLFEENRPEGKQGAGQTVAEPFGEDATPEETNDHNAVYEEDYDAELYDIFIQQLREDFEWFQINATAERVGGDHQATIERSKAKLVSLKSSSNYMGYQKLTRIYDNWEEQLDGVIAKIRRGKETDWRQEVLSIATKYLKEITALFPKAEQLQDVVIKMKKPPHGIENDQTHMESLDEFADVSQQSSILSEALTNKISTLTQNAETPHEVLSDYLFTDETVHPETVSVHDAVVEDPGAPCTVEAGADEEPTTDSTVEIANNDRDKAMQLVGFKIGKELFGVDILSVQEIIRSTPITPIPDSPDFIEGVINLRGNIIPVIDLRKRLNLLNDGSKENNLWVVILNVNNRVTGFIVDQVTQVLKINADSIKPAPDIVVTGLQRHYIIGVCKIDDSLLVLLDFNQILRIDEIKKQKALRYHTNLAQGGGEAHNHQTL